LHRSTLKVPLFTVSYTAKALPAHPLRPRAKERPPEVGRPAQPTGPTLWLLNPSASPSRPVTEFGSCEVRYFSNKQPQLVISPSAAAKTKIAGFLSQTRPFSQSHRRPAKARRSHRPKYLRTPPVFHRFCLAVDRMSIGILADRVLAALKKHWEATSHASYRGLESHPDTMPV
jgi:hypothetical protein